MTRTIDEPLFCTAAEARDIYGVDPVPKWIEVVGSFSPPKGRTVHLYRVSDVKRAQR